MKKHIFRYLSVFIILSILILTCCCTFKESINTIQLEKNEKKSMLNQEDFSLISSTLEEETITEENCIYEYMQNNAIKLMEYCGDKGIVIVPQEINSLNINEINENCFIHSDNIEIIKIPKEIAENVKELNKFKLAEDIIDDHFVVYITERKYNSEYIEYIKLNREEKNNLEIIPDRFELSEENSIKDSNILNNNLSATVEGTSTIPTSYDMRDKISMSVKNQGPLGICYSYASLTSAETYMKINKNTTTDFSEIYLAVASGYGAGGSFMSYFMRHTGFVVEKKDTLLEQKFIENNRGSNANAKYIYDICDDATNIDPSKQKTVIDALNEIDTKRYFLVGYGQFTSMDGDYKENKTQEEVNSERNLRKKIIMNYGSIYASIISPNNYCQISNGKKVMYTPEKTTGLGRHAVSIIGWDDNFYDFPQEWKNKGIKKGAWLALNQWGGNWRK